MLEREGRWLLQLRDDIAGIVAPGTWGLFGGHVDPGEKPQQAIQRELLEEIAWASPELPFWFRDANPQRIAHFFRGRLTVPMTGLQLLEGQDLVLTSLEELKTGSVWSPRLRERRPLAASLRCAVERLEAEG
jgi:8-oxo-dGTP diphosphatase